MFAIDPRRSGETCREERGNYALLWDLTVPHANLANITLWGALRCAKTMKFSLFGSLPNLISLGRLLLVPAIIALIAAQRWREAFVCFIIAGVSDALDGWLAKTFDLRTELGAYLDPIADKALLVSIYVALAIVGAIPRPSPSSSSRAIS